MFTLVNLMADEFAAVKLQLTLHGIDFLWITIILVGCRPRSEWPEDFGRPLEEFTASHHSELSHDAAAGSSTAPLVHESENST